MSGIAAEDVPPVGSTVRFLAPKEPDGKPVERTGVVVATPPLLVGSGPKPEQDDGVVRIEADTGDGMEQHTVATDAITSRVETPDAVGAR